MKKTLLASAIALLATSAIAAVPAAAPAAPVVEAPKAAAPVAADAKAAPAVDAAKAAAPAKGHKRHRHHGGKHAAGNKITDMLNAQHGAFVAPVMPMVVAAPAMPAGAPMADAAVVAPVPAVDAAAKPAA